MIVIIRYDLLIYLIRVDSPVEIVIGTIFLYNLLGMCCLNPLICHCDLTSIISGVSCFFGLAVACLFLPLNHYASKVVVGAQENLMKARDERVALMNEVRIFSRTST